MITLIHKIVFTSFISHTWYCWIKGQQIFRTCELTAEKSEADGKQKGEIFIPSSSARGPLFLGAFISAFRCRNWSLERQNDLAKARHLSWQSHTPRLWKSPKQKGKAYLRSRAAPEPFQEQRQEWGLCPLCLQCHEQCYRILLLSLHASHGCASHT